ncbi:hypothetical protein ACFW7O_43510, partial [Streptomyces diastatochromogenes]|uniref:hypothetical protein n=1 Tax=Streptomyces diastatochromogenes TaxID=42236 RepID=UPI0036764992
RKLSLTAPMVLQGGPCGRVGRRRTNLGKTPASKDAGVFCVADPARLFDAYARRSAVAEATPDAVDVSDVEPARRIVEEEQARLGMTDARRTPIKCASGCCRAVRGVVGNSVVHSPVPSGLCRALSAGGSALCRSCSP